GVVCERGADGEREAIGGRKAHPRQIGGRALSVGAKSLRFPLRGECVLTGRMAKRILLGLLLMAWSGVARAWDYHGHRMVNEASLATLPKEFTDFVRDPAVAERILFLAGEPDRWKSVSEPILRESGGSW